MEPHAGFAGVIAFAQDVVQDRLFARHGNDKIKRRFKSDRMIPDLARVQTDLYIDVPRLTMSHDRPEHLQIALRGWGRLTVTLAGQMAVGRRVRFSTTVIVKPKLEASGAGINLSLDPDDLTLDPAPALVSIGDGAVPSAISLFLDSDQFQATVEQQLRDALTGQSPTSIDLSFVGDLATAAGKSFVVRLFDGAMVIGVDLASDEVTTTGDPAQLTDVRGGRSIAYWLNPFAARATFSRIARAVRKSGATVSGPAFDFHEGSMSVLLIASNAMGQAFINFDLTPRFGMYIPAERIVEETFTEIVPGYTRDVLWFEPSKVDVDVVESGGIAFAEGAAAVFTLGVFTIGVQAIIDAYRSGIVHTLSTPAAGTERAMRFTLKNTVEPIFVGRLEQYDMHPNGVFAAISLHTEVYERAIIVTSSTDSAELSRGPLTCQIKLPFGLSPYDRQLQVRWTLRRLDTGAVLDEVNPRTFDPDGGKTLTYSVDLLALGLLASPPVPELEIACRFYRPLGAETEELFQFTRVVRIIERLDRTHPFVLWRHDVRVPDVRVNPDDTRDHLGFVRLHRESHIHRTDVPGRCRFAAEASGHLVYLDALPFPHADLVRRRAALCDYCFFGGPTRTRPLI